MSGAGKTTAQNSLEDLGFMCVDNMPPTFIELVVDLLKNQEQNKNDKVGFIFDIKFHDVQQILTTYHHLKQQWYKEHEIELLFLDASDTELLGRYRETRRIHPLATEHVSLAEAIKQERAITEPLSNEADVVFDTTGLSAKEFTARINSMFGGENKKGIFNITFTSFGFKYGVPADADFLLDVRFLPNPFYVAELRVQTGLTNEVSDYVLATQAGQEFFDKTTMYLEYLLAAYQKDKRNNFIVAIGCTGGQHRSVAIAEALYRYFKDTYVSFVKHRDMDKNTHEVIQRYQNNDKEGK